MLLSKAKKPQIRNIPVSLVIPVFNGENVVINQINSCEKILKKFTNKYEILIADDKSTDNTPLLLKNNFNNKSKIHLKFNDYNKGIAKNIKYLYHKAKYDYICLYSCDGDWYPDDIKRLITFTFNNNADLVIGERVHKNYNFYRKVISYFYNMLPILFFNINTIDAGSIKVIKKDLILNTKIISKSVFFEAELIIRNHINHKKILSLPIKFNRKTKKGSGGKLSLVFDSLVDLIKLRFSL